jgi:hypothetical protein
MHELIIIEKTTGHELGRSEMHPSERYRYYDDYRDQGLLVFNAKQYTIHSVAWRIPEQDLVLGVSFHSHMPYCDD